VGKYINIHTMHPNPNHAVSPRPVAPYAIRMLHECYAMLSKRKCKENARTMQGECKEQCKENARRMQEKKEVAKM
jgi:hypothetical protein